VGEFDLKNALWRLPPEKMKARKPHIVPLSRQAVALVKRASAALGREQVCIPESLSAEKPLSENTLVGALRRLGIDKGEQTAHGVRAAASTLLNEQDWNSDLIELAACSHAERPGQSCLQSRSEKSKSGER